MGVRRGAERALPRILTMADTMDDINSHKPAPHAFENLNLCSGDRDVTSIHTEVDTPLGCSLPVSDDNTIERLLETFEMPDEDAHQADGDDILPDVDQDNGRRLSRQPLKQKIDRLRQSTRPSIQIFVADYDRDLIKKKARRRALENEERMARRAAKRAAPSRAIEHEGRKRLRFLELALKYQRGDKLLEQLAGRAKDLTDFWMASKLAALEISSGTPSDRVIAEHFTKLSGTLCNKDQARTRRNIIEKLELHSQVWFDRKFA